jgi:phage repressor protein C with HTH and peptisase S24 domain
MKNRDSSIIDGLRQLVAKSGSARSLSQAAGLAPAFISNVINGGSSPSVDNLRAICEAAGTTLTEFLEGIEQVQTITVVGTASAGLDWIVSDDALDEVPFQIAGPAVALRVKGDSMLPAYRDGDLLAGAKRVGDQIRSLIGKDCIVMTSDGERLIKFLTKGSRAGFYTLKSYNPSNEDLRDRRLEWAAAIEWIKRG